MLLDIFDRTTHKLSINYIVMVYKGCYCSKCWLTLTNLINIFILFTVYLGGKEIKPQKTGMDQMCCKTKRQSYKFSVSSSPYLLNNDPKWVER